MTTWAIAIKGRCYILLQGTLLNNSQKLRTDYRVSTVNCWEMRNSIRAKTAEFVTGKKKREHMEDSRQLGGKTTLPGTATTAELWKHRKQTPTFIFLISNLCQFVLETRSSGLQKIWVIPSSTTPTIGFLAFIVTSVCDVTYLRLPKPLKSNLNRPPASTC